MTVHDAQVRGYKDGPNDWTSDDSAWCASCSCGWVGVTRDRHNTSGPLAAYRRAAEAEADAHRLDPGPQVHRASIHRSPNYHDTATSDWSRENPRYAAICTCGWIGPDRRGGTAIRDSSDDARIHQEDHR